MKLKKLLSLDKTQALSCSLQESHQVQILSFLAYSLKHARDLVRAISKKVKNQPPPLTSQSPLRRTQPALQGIGAGHVPLFLPPIRKTATS